MPKTVTIRLEDSVYNIFKKAAEGERRSISNFIEWASLLYLANEIYVSDEEMEDIMKLAPSLNAGIDDVKKGKYKIVK